MEQLTAINCLLAVCGLLLHAGAMYQSAKKKKGFNTAKFIDENVIALVMAIVAAFASLLMSEEIIQLLGMPVNAASPFYKIHALISGYMGSSILTRVFKVMKK